MRHRILPTLAAATVLACARPALAQTWAAVGPPGNPVVVALLSDPSAPARILAGSNGGGIEISPDSGASWGASNLGLTSLNVTSLAAFLPATAPGVPPLPPIIYAGTSDGGVFKSVSSGATWAPANNGLTNQNVTALACAASTGAIYAATTTGVFKSTDNAANWASVSSGLTNPSIASLAIDPGNPLVLFAGTLGSIYRTSNGGTGWSSVYSQISALVGSIAIDPANSSIVYAGTSLLVPSPPAGTPGDLLKSTNGGGTWAPSSNGLPGLAVTSIAIDATASARIYLGTGSAGAFASKNFGASWTAQNTGLSDLHVLSMTVAPASPPTVYAGTQSAGVFRAVTDAVGVCSVGTTNLCLQANRFRVEVAWSVPADGRNGLGQAIPLSADTGTFWFFDSANYELMIKVLDGRGINGHIWVFYGALSNVQYTITVTDTQTGAIKNYTNPSGTLASVADTSAF